MRQWLAIILLFLALTLPFAGRWAFKEPVAPPVAGARRLVIITANTQDIRRAFADAFSRWYRGKYGEDVVLDYRVPGGGNDILRQLTTTYQANRDANGKLREDFHPDIDMVWGGGDYFFDVELKRHANVLEAMDIDPALLRAAFPEPMLAGVKLYDYQGPTPSPGTPGEGRGGGPSSAYIVQHSEFKSPHPYPPPEYQGRERFAQPMWVGVCLSSMGIMFNADSYRAIGIPAPKSWSDLGKEKLSGMVALADPNHSASVALAYMMVVQSAMQEHASAFRKQFLTGDRKQNRSGGGKKEVLAAQAARGSSIASTGRGRPGSTTNTRGSAIQDPIGLSPEYQNALAEGWKDGMETLQRIAGNARYFTAWGSEVPNDVGSGDAAAGIAIDFYVRVYSEEVGADRCQFIAPVGETSTTPDPIGILACVRGEQYELANRFIEFLLSPEGQRLWIVKAGSPGGPREHSLRRMPIREDVYGDQQDWTDHVNPFASARGFNQRNDWMSLFTDMRILWTAAWIDCRDELRDAHEAVMRVGDAGKRGELLDQLAGLPITMEELYQFASERARLQKQAGGDLAEFTAKEQMALAGKFREHYRKIKDSVEGWVENSRAVQNTALVIPNNAVLRTARLSSPQVAAQ